MKIIKRPNKSIEELLKKISKSCAMQLYAKDGEKWKELYFTQSQTFSDFKIWIKNTFKD